MYLEEFRAATRGFPMKELSDSRLEALRGMRYTDYLLTPEWRQRRDRALARALWRCEWPQCGTQHRLEVHHKSYEHLGEELDSELAVLCGHHHRGYHERWDVRLVVIRAAMRDRYDSFAEFIEAVKAACVKHQLSYDDAQFREAVRRVEHDLRLEARRPAPFPLELDTSAPAITPRDAQDLMVMIRERTGLAPTIKSMRPIVLSPDRDDIERAHQAARERAWEMGVEL
jgi:hypothetical protein